jgi:oxygen-independent coproporphyrinogen-3 oxidase
MPDLTVGPNPAEPGFGLYVHWPFCRSKCPYCDFNSHVREAVDDERWRRALVAELDHFAGLTPGRRLTSIFFGGGTPSLMAPATAGALIERAAGHWSFAGDIEITLEANPNSAEAARFRDFRAAGVNRLSLGVQALNDADLRALGRAHDAGEARAAIALSQAIFPRSSFDLIYARAGQELGPWRAELEEALALAGEHLSLYQLTIEPQTVFEARHRRGELILPDDDVAAEFFELTNERLAAAGLYSYEISNHARPGAESRHNLTYWRYGDYVGVGPGAHGRLTLAGAKTATRQHRAPEAWLEAVEGKGQATRTLQALTPEEQETELLMMGLRLVEGVAEERFKALRGHDFDRLLERGAGRALIAGGFLVRGDGRLQATAAGRLRLDAVLGALLA